MHSEAKWLHLLAITRPALISAPRFYLENIRQNLISDGIPAAIARSDTPFLFNHLVGVIQFQGISDRNAASFTAKNGLDGWDEINADLDAGPTCPRLRSYWDFNGCGYRKGAATCAEPDHIGCCPLPRHPTRKGSLIQAAHSLFLFVRDICDGDLIGWIDQRLAAADAGVRSPDRAVLMGTALLDPLRSIFGIGDKVWSMALSYILLASDPNRERWVATGASMVVIDSLMHNHFHRTGVLRRFNAEHAYGPRCYAPGGCSDLIRGLAHRIDARQFDDTFPASFPRFIQFAVCRLCSTSERDFCNGNRIDDRHRCENAACPVFAQCDRLTLNP